MDLVQQTEIISLPSKGVLYSSTSVLAKAEIEMKYMTAAQEDILTNINYLKDGTIIEKLLKSLIVTPIDFNELLIGDKDAILIAARILGYGKEYEISYSEDSEPKQGVVDLSTLKEKELDPSLIKQAGVNEFDFTLPNSGIAITFKLLTHGDEKKIEEEIKGLQKLQPQGSYEVSTRLKYLLISVQGKRDLASIREFVDKFFRVNDARALRDYYNKIAPGVELKYYPKDSIYSVEGVDFRIGLNFFWPDTRI